MTDPIRPAQTIRPTDDEARGMARDLLTRARFAALAVGLADGTPMVTRVAFGLSPEGAPLTLVSDLSAHTGALRASPACSLLLGEPGPKGDPLTHPRLTLQATARFVGKGEQGHDTLAAHYLTDHPKARIYIGFALFSVRAGHLNGGFGKAFRLTAADMGLPG